MELCSDNGLGVYAERAVYWRAGNSDRGAGSDSTGITELSTEWFLAEGSETGNRRTVICVGNPNDEEAVLEVSYLLENEDPVVTTYTLAGERRLTIFARQDVPNRNFSVQIISSVPVVVEREMFGPANGNDDKWGHNAPGVTEPSDCWLFAEGAVHNSFVTFLLIANINDFPITANIRFLLSNGDPIVKSVEVPAKSRRTINVEQAFAEMQDQAGFGIEVKTDDGSKIVVERAMYWTGNGFTDRSGATAVVGLTRKALRWLLPEGAVGGSSGFENFILCVNSENQAAAVTVTFVKPDGSTVSQNYIIGAGQRFDSESK